MLQTAGDFTQKNDMDIVVLDQRNVGLLGDVLHGARTARKSSCVIRRRRQKDRGKRDQ